MHAQTAELPTLQALKQRAHQLLESQRSLQQQNQALAAERLAFDRERALQATQLQELSAERDSLTAHLQELTAQRDSIQQQLKTLQKRVEELSSERGASLAKEAMLQQEHVRLSTDHQDLDPELDPLLIEQATLTTKVKVAASETDTLTTQRADPPTRTKNITAAQNNRLLAINLTVAKKLLDPSIFALSHDAPTLVAACAALLANNEIDPVHDAIISFKYKTADPSVQYRFLRELAGVETLPAYLRIYCQTVSSYRAVEMGDPQAVSECMGSIESTKLDVFAMAQSSDIRQDRHHLFFSTSVSNVHLFLASKNFSNLQTTCNEIINYLEQIDPPTLTSAFYSTSTLVARCVGFAYFFKLLFRAPGPDVEYAKLLRDALIIGLSKADDHPIRHKEFMLAICTYDSLIRLQEESPRLHEAADRLTDKAIDFAMDLLKLCLRTSGDQLLIACENLLRCPQPPPGLTESRFIPPRGTNANSGKNSVDVMDSMQNDRLRR